MRIVPLSQECVLVPPPFGLQKYIISYICRRELPIISFLHISFYKSTVCVNVLNSVWNGLLGVAVAIGARRTDGRVVYVGEKVYLCTDK